MFKKSRLFVFGLLCSLSTIAFSQEIAVLKGKVTVVSDETPLMGASVGIKGSSKGTITNLDGEYKLNNVKIGDVLTVYYVGMQTVTVKVTSSVMNVKMDDSAVQLDEVVAIGYGSAKKSDITGAVVSVKSENLQKTALTSFDQGIQGRIAGVEVVQADATPGGAAFIQIRGVSTLMGSTEPLYVVDGIPFNIQSSLSTTSTAGYSNTNPLASISPSDIESIEVLKDASATAIYGSQGANGVVLIRTKQGQEGKAKITLTTNQSVAMLSRKIQVLNARQYAEYKNEAYANNSPSSPQTSWDYPLFPQAGSTKLSPAQLESLVGKGVDWQDEIYRPAHAQEYSLSIQGGTARNKYAFMMGYLDQQGILLNTSFNRFSARINADNKLNDWLQMITNVSFASSENRLVKTSSNDGSSKAGGVVRKALTYSPIPALIKDASGRVVGYADNPANMDVDDPSYESNWGSTPLRFLQEAMIAQSLMNVNGNVQFKIKLSRDFDFSTRLGGTYYEQKNDNYFPRTLNEGITEKGLAQMGLVSFGSFITENLLTYRAKFKDKRHKVDAMIGMTYEESQNRSTKLQASGFADDLLTIWAMKSATLTQPIEVAANKWAMLSFFGRANYSFGDRYLFTYTIRNDGSSKFAQNHKRATFQSVALAWRMDQERFLKETFVSTLKLRLSYGESGNQGLSPYQSLSIITPTASSVGNVLGNAYLEDQQQNPNLKWETTSQVNIGVDFGFWKERLSGSINLYSKDTRDLLQSIVMAPSTGYKNRTLNSGRVQNQGIELDFNIRPISNRDFNWNINLNWYTNRNRILDLGPVKEQFSPTLGAAYGLNVQPFIQRVGEPIGAIYGYVFKGIVQNQEDVRANTYISVADDGTETLIVPNVGDPKFEDVNKDGRLTTADQTIIGDTNPDFLFGFNNTISYKKWDFGVFVSGVVGGDVINTTFMTPALLDGRSNVPTFLYEEAWRGDGTSDSYRIIKSANTDVNKFSRQYLDKRTHVRIKNIYASYLFTFAKKFPINSLKVGVSVVNPFTFTQYKGYDPEVSASTNATSRGVDMGNYPQACTFSLNLSCTF